MIDTLLHPRVLDLVASRICHDLVSPVGAISNGVELMEELGDSAEKEAMALISNSAGQAASRLKAFRLCYGAGGTDKNISFNDIIDAFQNLISSGRVTLHVENSLNAVLSMPQEGFFKCLLNVLILAEECSHGEGSIILKPVKGSEGIEVMVVGKKPGFRDGAESALLGKTDPDNLDARSIHSYMTGVQAKRFNINLDWKNLPEDGQISFFLSMVR